MKTPVFKSSSPALPPLGEKQHHYKPSLYISKASEKRFVFDVKKAEKKDEKVCQIFKIIIFTPPRVIGKKGVIGDGGVGLSPLVLESSQHHYWQPCHHLVDKEGSLPTLLGKK